jgi:tripartite-type tricarboxylate transporter receptor subunit TctC
MRHSLRCVWMALLVGNCIGATIGHATAESVEDFYKGRTLALLVATSPGGRYDLNARLIARFLGNFIPGHPNVIVQDLTGASGVLLGNRLYNSTPRDGSVISVMEPGIPQVAVGGDPNARFEPLKMTWIGSLSSFAQDADLLIVNVGHPAMNVADLKKPGISAKLGAVSPGSTNLTFSIIARDLLKLHVEPIRGYPGAAPIFLAMERGEVDGQVVLLSSIRIAQPAFWANRKFRALVQFGRVTRVADLPDVPTARELLTDPKDLSLLEFAEQPFFMSVPVVAPPDVPADRVDSLRKAFMEMTRDPAFLETARAGNFEISPIDGDAVHRLIAKLVATPKDVISLYQTVVAAPR